MDENEHKQRPPLQAAIDTYMRLLPEMLEEHEGKWVVFRDGDEELLGGFWHCEQDAMKVAFEKCGNAPFLVRQVSQEYVQYGRFGRT